MVRQGIKWKSMGLLLLLAIGIGGCMPSPQGKQYDEWRADKKGRKEVLNGPKNMIYVPGGEFIMGELELAAIAAEKFTLPHKEEIDPFYLDRTEVTNQSYLIYLNWLRKYAEDELDYQFALPDTHCWHQPLAYNEPLVRNYLRHPSFQYYPVVGVSWVQASQYCEWRSARINELDSLSDDSIVIRLPTEAEWEFAALASYNYDETSNSNARTAYVRQPLGFGRGKFTHNFQRGRGDLAGLSHRPNDNAFVPAPVYAYELNEFGLYNIYGNVAEWVGDVYLPVTIEDITEPVNPNDSLYRDSSGAGDPEFVTPDQTFKRVMDSLGIDGTDDTEVETDITGDILRVYKGGSWRDRAYYLGPGTRRFLAQNSSTSFIGFRCASDIPEDLKKEKPTGSGEEGTISSPADSSGGGGGLFNRPSKEERKKAREERRKQRKQEKEDRKKEKDEAEKEESPEIEEEDPDGA